MSDLIRQSIEKDELTYGMFPQFYLISSCPGVCILPWANRLKHGSQVRVQFKKASCNHTPKARILQNISL